MSEVLPVVALADQLLCAQPDGSFMLPEDKLPRLVAAYAEVPIGPELVATSEQLLEFARYLADEKASLAAAQLLGNLVLAAAELLEQSEDRQAKEAAQQVLERGARFGSFMGEARRARVLTADESSTGTNLIGLLAGFKKDKTK